MVRGLTLAETTPRPLITAVQFVASPFRQHHPRLVDTVRVEGGWLHSHHLLADGLHAHG
jgi:hypothetical protein